MTALDPDNLIARYSDPALQFIMPQEALSLAFEIKRLRDAVTLAHEVFLGDGYRMTAETMRRALAGEPEVQI